MAQFDVYINPNTATAPFFPFLLDLQHDLHASLKTRLIVPLARNMTPLKHLNPRVSVAGESLIVMTEQTASVPLSQIGKKIANIEANRSELLDALDFLINGF